MWIEARSKSLGVMLVDLALLPVRPFFGIESFFAFAWFLLFFSGFEDALFAAADSLMRVQAFEDEFGGGDLLLGAAVARDLQRAEFVEQALNLGQIVERVGGGDGI